MKLPKSVIINGYKWNVKEDPNMYGGGFECKNKTIIIGGVVPNEKLEIFLHEVAEAVLTTRGHRYNMYGNGTNDRLLFSLYHHELENVIKDVMIAIKDIIKE